MTSDRHPEGESKAPEESTKEGGLTATRAWSMVLVLMLISVFSFADRKLTLILAEPIKNDLGLSDVQLGLLNGLAFLAVYAIAAIPIGAMADRGSSRNLLAILIAFWSVMTALGAAAANFIQLALTRAGVAIGEAGGTPAAHALIQRGIPRSQRGRALALYQMGAGLGQLVGMGLGGWLAAMAGWRTVLIGAGAAGLIVIALLLLVVPDLRSKGKAVERARTWPIVRQLLRSRAFLSLFIAVSMLGTVAAATFAFMPPFLIRIHGMPLEQVGILLGAAWFITGTLGLAAGGILFDRAQSNGNYHILFWPGVAFLVAGAISIPAFFVGSGFLAVALLAASGFAGNLHFPTTFGSAHAIAGPGNHAVASSLILFGVSLVGGVVGPLLVGGISDGLRPSMGNDGLRWAMAIVIPLFCFATGAALMFANRHVGFAMRDLHQAN